MLKLMLPRFHHFLAISVCIMYLDFPNSFKLRSKLWNFWLFSSRLFNFIKEECITFEM